MEQSILSLLIFLPVLGALIMVPVSKYIGSDKIKWTALITYPPRRPSWTES